LTKLQNKPFWIWNIEEHKQEDIRNSGERAILVRVTPGKVIGEKIQQVGINYEWTDGH